MVGRQQQGRRQRPRDVRRAEIPVAERNAVALEVLEGGDGRVLDAVLVLGELVVVLEVRRRHDDGRGRRSTAWLVVVEREAQLSPSLLGFGPGGSFVVVRGGESHPHLIARLRGTRKTEIQSKCLMGSAFASSAKSSVAQPLDNGSRRCLRVSQHGSSQPPSSSIFARTIFPQEVSLPCPSTMTSACPSPSDHRPHHPSAGPRPSPAGSGSSSPLPSFTGRTEHGERSG